MKKIKTKAQLRIEIAKDVLKHIKANKIIAETGTYFEPKIKAEYKGKQLQEVLPKIKECTVCALGGLFYSYVGKHNNFQIDQEGLSETEFNDYEMRDLMSMFSKHQLYLIECAFEGKDIRNRCHYNSNIAPSTRRNAQYYKDTNEINDDEEALIHIMKNIIRNKGTFKP